MLTRSLLYLILGLTIPVRATAQHAPVVRAGRTATTDGVARIVLPGGPTWDHITAATETRRLYLAHESHVDVLDLDGDTIVAVIRPASSAHGVALAHDIGKGFTSNGGDSSLTVFDLRTNAITGRVRLREDAPDGIAYDPTSQRIFAMHSDRPSLSVVDARSHAVIKVVALGDTPDGGVPDNMGHLFVALKPTSRLAVVDTRTLDVKHLWSLSPCRRPDAIAFDHRRQEVVLGCNNRLAVVVRAADGVVLSSFPIGLEVDGLSLDGDGNAVVSCGDGTLHFAQRQGDRFRVTRVVRTAKGAPNSALDTKRNRVYVPTGAPVKNARTGAPVKSAFGLMVITAPPPSLR